MKGWHFVREDRKLGYEDGRFVKAGRVYRVKEDRELELCNYGLHASRRILDALQYAPGPVLCRVELLGAVIHDTDKAVAYARRVDWTLDATELLSAFARRCALDVVHLWDPPEIVLRYLKTGDDSIRDAARDAAWDAARAAARAAARDKQNRRLAAMATAEAGKRRR